MSGYMEEYLRWRQAEKLAPQLKAELEAIADNPKEIEERFYTELEFGTAGLRGILGAGTNRMNARVIKRATLGLSEYILGFAGGAERSPVCIRSAPANTYWASLAGPSAALQ